jgi:glutamate--cysteine ligase
MFVCECFAPREHVPEVRGAACSRSASRYVKTSQRFLCGQYVRAGVYPTMKDWETHLTTIFPEVRLKRYMEMRGADGGPWDIICALPALWVGLLYDMCAPSYICVLLFWPGAGKEQLGHKTRNVEHE